MHQLINTLLPLWRLPDTYDYMRESILWNAEDLGLKPVYRFGNESRRELPMGFETNDADSGFGIKCRHTNLGNLMEKGTLEELIDILKVDENGNSKITKLLKEMFNGADEYFEKQSIENARTKSVEMAPEYEKMEEEFFAELENRGARHHPDQ